MEPATIILILAVLACPIGMGLMMWQMNRRMESQSGHAMPGDRLNADPAERLAALRAQRQALQAEIAETAKIAELEAKREALLSSQNHTPEVAKDETAAEGA